MSHDIKATLTHGLKSLSLSSKYLKILLYCKQHLKTAVWRTVLYLVSGTAAALAGENGEKVKLDKTAALANDLALLKE